MRSPGDYPPDVNYILKSTDLPDWRPQLLRDLSLRYVVVDRRVRSFDSMSFNFGLCRRRGRPTSSLPAGVATSSIDCTSNKLYSSGTITVYDLEPILAAEAKR